MNVLACILHYFCTGTQKLRFRKLHFHLDYEDRTPSPRVVNKLAGSHSFHAAFYPPACNMADQHSANQPYRRTSDVTASRNNYIRGASSTNSSFDAPNQNARFNASRQSSVDMADTSPLAMLLHPSEQKIYGGRRLPERYSSANTIYVHRNSSPVSPYTRGDVSYNGDMRQRRPSLDVNFDQVFTNTPSTNRRRILPVTPSHVVRLDHRSLRQPSTELTQFSSSMNPLPSHRNEYTRFRSMSRDHTDDIMGYRDPSACSSAMTVWPTDELQSHFNADRYSHVKDSPRREINPYLQNDWDSSSDEINSGRNMVSSKSCNKIRDEAERDSRGYNPNVHSREGKFRSLSRLGDSERTFDKADMFSNPNSSRNYFHASNEDEIDALFECDPLRVGRPTGHTDLHLENLNPTMNRRKMEVTDSFEDEIP